MESKSEYLEISEDNKTILSCDHNASGCITIPEGIECIEEHAFSGCKSIQEIILPKSLLFIKCGAFRNCYSLENIRIPESIEEVPWYCFQDCINLHYVQLPEGLKKIDSEAFKGCINLQNLKIPTSVTEICHSAFEDCSSLEKISIPDNVSSINSETFHNCISLHEVNLPNKITSIGVKSFSGCQSLLYIQIPKDVKDIHLEAFSDCVNLICVIIESTDISINPTAFFNCISINRLYLANFTPNIVISAFGYCRNLNIISPLSDLNRIKSKESTDFHTVHKNFASILKYMSLYYRLFGMNLTQIKWSESLQDLSFFKHPISQNWTNYKTIEQPLSDILNIDWSYSSGLGLILGFNNYRALDFDIDGMSNFTYLVQYHGTVDNFILETLEKLGLPKNYPWVVRSGSGYGFHIIFKCEDIEATKNWDSISFEPNNNYKIYNIEYFKRLELRWADHLVLPPSIHASGNQYRFRNNNLPTCPPSQLDLTTIDKLILEYCGNRQIFSGKYGDIEFYYTNIEKLHCRYDSYLTPDEYNEDSISYLRDIISPEGLNTLALRYLFAKDVDFDKDLMIKYFEESNTQSSLFNLLNLYACGFLKCDRDKFNKLFSQLDKDIFREHIDLLLNNANMHISESKFYLFIDTETTGLPLDYNAPSSNVENWPRIVQISWIVTDEFQNIISKHNHIVYPNGFSIPKESTSVHGISTEYAEENGIYIEDVLDFFKDDLSLTDYLVGHNIQFDKKVIEAEIFRSKRKTNKEICFDNVELLCTMKSTANFCKLPWAYHTGYRYPKLSELYSTLFGQEFTGAHNAFDDIKATMRCFWELKNKYHWNNDKFKTLEN